MLRLRLAVSLALTGLLTAACDPSLLNPPETDAGPTTYPDGGPLVTTGGTSGSLTGPTAFTVTSGSELLLSDSQKQGVGYAFVLSSSGLTCAQLQALNGTPPALAYTYVEGMVLRSQGGLAAPTPGTYNIGGASSATELVGALQMVDHHIDGTFSTPRAALSGTITIAAASSTAFSGSFQAIVPDTSGAQSSLSGTFDVSYCP